MPLIHREPRIMYYERFIKYAIDTCDAFMLLVGNYRQDPLFEQRMMPFLKKLDPLLVKTRKDADCWPGTDSVLDPRREIRVYRSHPSAFESLIQPVSLYNWQYPCFPEDLAFFRKGYCWMGMVSHDETAFILSRDEEELVRLEKMGISFDKELVTINGKNAFQRRVFDEQSYNNLRFYEEYKL